MANVGPANNLSGSTAPPRWRGAGGEEAVIRHRWQRDWTTQPQQRLRRRERGRRIRVAAWLLLALAGIAALVWILMRSPIQTPMVVIAAPAYNAQFPPNSWAEEDLSGLLDERNGLHGKTLNIRDEPDARRSREHLKDYLERSLKDAATQAAKSGTIIIYVSMHGAVDGDGAACLVPPWASPTRSETWLPIRDLLSMIKDQKLPDEMNKLLILDCNRMRSQWELGLVYNGFADQLAAAVGEVTRDSGLPNLAVLNSAGSDQVGWSSPDLQGSVFGHFLKLGLAGAADIKSDDDEGVAGNGDGRVTLHELRDYLQRRVDQWVVANRADRQRPILLPDRADDFHVTWSLSKKARAELMSAASNVSRPEPNVPDAAVAALWRDHDEMKRLEPYRFDPLAWQNFERKLLWLEQISMSGQAYAKPARDTLAELQNFVAGAKQRGEAAQDSRAIYDHAGVFSDRAVRKPELLKLHSVALAEYFGQIDADSADALRDSLKRFQEDPKSDSVKAAVDRLKESSDDAAALAEGHFLLMLGRHLPVDMWRHADLVGRAVELRARAEYAAAAESDSLAAGDERAAASIRSLVEAGDEARRSAEDLLFIGDDTATAEAKDLFDKAAASYDEARDRAAHVAGALRIRDRALAEIPHLAKWFARPVRAGQSTDQADQAINQSLPRLVENLAAGAGDGQAGDVVERQMETLKAAFDAECKRLLAVEEKDRTAATLRDLADVLQSPLIEAPMREELRKAQASIAKNLREAWSPGDSSEPSKTSGGVDESTDAGASGYLDRVALRWQQHPALTILGAKGSEEPSTKPNGAEEKHRGQSTMLAASAAAHGQRIRRILDDLPRSIRNAQQGNVAGAERETDESASPRDGFVRAAHLARSAAAMGLPALEEDPVGQLRQFDLQQLLIWNGRRVLRDFWGPAPGVKKSFFDVVAADYLAGAEAIVISREPIAAVDRQFAEIRERLKRLQGAATQGVTTTATDILLIEGEDQLTSNVTVQARRDQVGALLPAGQAAVFLREPGGKPTGAIRRLDMGKAETTKDDTVSLPFTLSSDDLAERGPFLDAVTRLRGHEYVAGLLIKTTKGIEIRHRRHDYGPPQVTVSARHPQRASVVFILDCSQSMNQRMNIEGPEGELTRLEVAKMAMNTMLDKLAKQGDARVGVRFYGHRVGWNVNKAGDLLRQTDYARDIPTSLRPSEDVESVLRLGRFDDVEAGKVAKLLTTVKPWGETPLYLGIVEALGDFSGEPEDTAKSIVVITDGVNFQFNSPDPKRKADVIAAWERSNVPVHLIGFGIPKEDEAEAKSEFESVAQETKGSYQTPATNSAELVKAIQGLLGTKRYRVVNKASEKSYANEVGLPVDIEPAPSARQAFTVALESASEPIVLDGGEALQLAVSADGTRIESLPYLIGDPKFAPLIDSAGGDRTPFDIGVHRPVRQTTGSDAQQSQDVTFRISIRHRDDGFAPRPAEMWVEITPVLPAGSDAPTYTFYDALYEPKTPTPVLLLDAKNWPAAAKKASVRVWCKNAATPATWPALKPGDGVVDRNPPSGEGHPLKDFAGVTYQIRTNADSNPGQLRIRVVEKHNDRSTGINALKVQTHPVARNILHRFDAENKIVVHEFSFDSAEGDSKQSPEITLTTRDDALRGSWRLDEPVVVDISDETDLLPADAKKKD